MPTDKQYYTTAKKVSINTIIINLLLGVFKILAGVFGHSTAMIADGFHTASDVVTTILVIIGIKISSKAADYEHPYGHEKFEPIFGKIISVFLCLTGVVIGYEGLTTLIYGHYTTPTPIALIAALVSIITKEAMYWYTIKTARQIKSVSMKADAWHHRTDAFSSIGTFIGILGARLGFTFLDPLTALIVCLFIIKISIKLYLQSVNQLIDKAADTEIINKLETLALSIDGVNEIHDMKTRIAGNKLYVDIEIGINPSLTVVEGHSIATKVHDLIEFNIPDVKHCMVHMEPLCK